MAVDFSNAVRTDKGVQVSGIIMQEIIDKCEGCNRIQEFDGSKFCNTYPQPAAKWRLGDCNFATHIVRETKSKTKINPLKASKRAAKGK